MSDVDALKNEIERLIRESLFYRLKAVVFEKDKALAVVVENEEILKKVVDDKDKALAAVVVEKDKALAVKDAEVVKLWKQVQSAGYEAALQCG